MASLENSLYRSISNYQENLLEEGKTFVGNWLSEQDDFEASVDWLFGQKANDLLEENKGTFAFDIVAYAIDLFENWLDENSSDDEIDEDESEDDTDDVDRSEFYDQVRDFFNC
jgi:hypothetical protein